MNKDKNKKDSITVDEGKHQLLLRLSNNLWHDLQTWAEDDFRSINGQIEYILSEAVKKKYKKNQ